MKQIIYLAFAILITMNASGTLAQQGSEDFHYSTNGERLVSIGDIHGDYDALVKILESAGLYSSQTDKWTGGKSTLVFTGDLLDRGPRSREVMDLVIKLEVMAAKKGGRVHTLLGNHELMVLEGQLGYLNENDLKDFEDFRKKPEDSRRKVFSRAFKGDTYLAQWIRTRPTMIVVNDTLFVHAGLEKWALKNSISQINSLTQEWVRFFQGIDKKPAAGTSWVIGESGPLWTRAFAGEEGRRSFFDFDFGMVSESDVKAVSLVARILKMNGAKRVAVGHSIVENRERNLINKKYGELVVMTDTAISIAYGGDLSFFEYGRQGVTMRTLDRESGQVDQIIKSQEAKVVSIPLCRSIYAK